MKKPKRILRINLFIACLVWAGAALGVDLDEIKRAGYAGERADGYVGLVKSGAPADAQALVKEINNKRRQEYQRIANGNDLTLDQVETLAGKKAMERTAAGGWILTSSGWRQK
jgi:uncharacterized protein YdbL (DUF1318 family)